MSDYQEPSGPSVPSGPTGPEYIAGVWQERFTEPVTGHVQKVRYRLGTFVVCELADGTVAVGDDDPEGEDGPITEGFSYSFHGEWQFHAKYGRNYRFGYYTRAVPTSYRGIADFLTRTCPGVGRMRAQRLWGMFKDKTVEVLRDTPEKIPAEIMTADAARKASEALQQNKDYLDTVVALYSLLAKRGFPIKALLKAVINQWGRRAPELIRADPWILLTHDMPGCGFKRVDRLWCDLHPRQFNHWKRVAMACWYVVDSDTTGHTWHKVEKVGREILKFIPTADPVHAIKVTLRAGWLVKLVDQQGVKWLAAKDAANAERSLATNLRRLVSWTVLPRGISDRARTLYESTQSDADGMNGNRNSAS